MATKKSELREKKEEYGLTAKIYCDSEENKEFYKMVTDKTKLPDDVFNDGYVFYRYKNSNLTEKETDELLRFYQLDYLKSIKNGVTFFVVLTVISLILSIVLFAIINFINIL